MIRFHLTPPSSHGSSGARSTAQVLPGKERQTAVSTAEMYGMANQIYFEIEVDDEEVAYLQYISERARWKVTEREKLSEAERS